MKERRCSDPSFMTNTAESAVVSLIAASPSSQDGVNAPFSSFAFIPMREQMLPEHPTPSSLPVLTLPLDKVTLTVKSDRCRAASRLRKASLAFNFSDTGARSEAERQSNFNALV